jgi:hypothetical protein
MQKKGDRSLKKSDRPFFLIKAGNRHSSPFYELPKSDVACRAADRLRPSNNPSVTSAIDTAANLIFGTHH